MKSNSDPGQPNKRSLRPLALAVVGFSLGIAITALWFHHHSSDASSAGLSVSTKNLLVQLSSPVTIRYYSLLPVGSADVSLQEFAGRVAKLLDAIQAAGGGKIKLVSVATPAEANANAATADGIQPFNLDKGDACFLGLAIAGGKNQEAFARLEPAWEPALEYDVARAILRVAATTAPARPAPETAKPSPEFIATVNRLIPDVNAVSTEQADQIFHAEFVKQCGEVGAETELQVNAAQQKLAEAQTSGSPADFEAAQKNLAQVQIAQGEKYKALAAQLQMQLSIFQQMKNGTPNATK